MEEFWVNKRGSKLKRKNSISKPVEINQDCPSCKLMESELVELKKQLAELQTNYAKAMDENSRMELVLGENELLDKPKFITDIEVLCMEQLRKFKAVAMIRTLEETEAKVVDLIYRNLRLARGEDKEIAKKSKSEKQSTLDLLKAFREIGN